MLQVWAWIRNLLSDDEGASMVEYALLLVLIAIVSIVILTALGENVNDTFTNVNNQFP